MVEYFYMRSIIKVKFDNLGLEGLGGIWVDEPGGIGGGVFKELSGFRERIEGAVEDLVEG
jgi:hypothetical protein